MKEESMRILITGAAGKLGSTAVESLRQAGHQVTGIDLTASSTTDHVIDIRDLKALIDLTGGFDAIIHTAALHGKQMDEGYDRQSFVDTNISGTLNLFKRLRAKWHQALFIYFFYFIIRKGDGQSARSGLGYRRATSAATGYL